MLRNTLALTTALAVIGFAAYSLMPPRLLDDPGEFGGCQIYAPEAAAAAPPRALAAPGCDEFGYVDTVAEFGGWISFGNEGMKDVSNQYAAMPSMHIGWSTWSAIVLLPLVRRRWAKALVVAYPCITLACIVVTANHYWIDGVGGLVCLGAGYALARAAHADPSRESRPPAPPEAQPRSSPPDGPTVVPGGGEHPLLAVRPGGEAHLGPVATGLHPQPGQRSAAAWRDRRRPRSPRRKRARRSRREVLQDDRVHDHRRHPREGQRQPVGDPLVGVGPVDPCRARGGRPRWPPRAAGADRPGRATRRT